MSAGALLLKDGQELWTSGGGDSQVIFYEIDMALAFRC